MKKNNGQTIVETEKLPEQKIRKERKDKGQKRTKKDSVKMDLTELKIPLAKIMRDLTIAISNMASKPCLAMTESESKNIDDGINTFLIWKVQNMENIYPYACLFIPITSYVARVSIELRMLNKQQKNSEPVSEKTEGYQKPEIVIRND